MIGPFRIHIPKHLTTLDAEALPAPIKDILLNGIAFRPSEHRIGRLSIAILPDPTFRGPMHIRRKKSYERVTHLFVAISLMSAAYEIIEVFPHTTLTAGPVDPQLEVGVSVDPFTGKFSLSGTLKNLIRRERHWIINTHTTGIAQWTYQKDFLKDNFQFNLEFLFKRKSTPDDLASLVCEVKAQERARLIRATRKRTAIEV